VAVKTDGTLWAWGGGIVGDGGTGIDRMAPVRVGAETGWASISAGSNHALALRF